MTTALPCPLALEVMLMKSGLLEMAVHGQLLSVITRPCPGPPPGCTDWEGGFNVNWQDDAPAFCVIVKVWLEIAIVPVRAGPVFGATA